MPLNLVYIPEDWELYHKLQKILHKLSGVEYTLAISTKASHSCNKECSHTAEEQFEIIYEIQDSEVKIQRLSLKQDWNIVQTTDFKDNL